MSPEHDNDLFGDEIDYEKYWRDLYHQSRRSFEDLISFSDGWIHRLCAENDNLQRQLLQAQKEIAALKKTSTPQQTASAETTPPRETNEQRATESPDDQPSAGDKCNGDTPPAPQTPLQPPKPPQANTNPFGRKPGSDNWAETFKEAGCEKRKRDDAPPEEGGAPSPKRSAASATPPSSPPPRSTRSGAFDASRFFDKDADTRREEAAHLAAQKARAEDGRAWREKRDRRHRQQSFPPPPPPPRQQTSRPSPTAANSPLRGGPPAFSRLGIFTTQALAWHETVSSSLSQRDNFPAPPAFPRSAFGLTTLYTPNEGLVCSNAGCKANKSAAGEGVCECSIRKAVSISLGREVSEKKAALKALRVAVHPDRWVGRGEEMAREVFVVVDGMYEGAR
ncbi:unnamed protein product [Cercospora beticola]|nr:unnamed protein product [Cercospora beticola]